MKKKLIFSLEQGWPDGVIAAQRFQAVRNFNDIIQPLKTKYDVYVLLTPTSPDRVLTENVLGLLKNIGLPFVLDSITSDAIALKIQPWHAPFNISHGIPISVYRVIDYKKWYGEYFAGIRSHETFSMDSTIRLGRWGLLDWWEPFKEYVPYDSYFKQDEIEPFVAECANAGMFFIWSDPHWSYNSSTWHYDRWNAELVGKDWQIQVANEKIVWNLGNKYKNIYPMYANNLSSAAQKNTYYHCLEPIITPYSLGWGLSDQAWLYGDPMKAPIEDIIDWAVRALVSGASIVEFEPIWYLYDIIAGVANSRFNALISRLMSI